MQTFTEPILYRVASGDQVAVDECLTRYGGLVWSIARRLTRNDADAEDAVQDIFIELWQKADRFDPEIANEPAFITMIARRRLIDRHRRRQRSLETSSLGDESSAISYDNPSHPVEIDDEAGKAADCFRQLRSAQKQVLELSIYGGVSHAKISDHLEIPIGSVKSHARRGLMQLRQCMDRSRVTRAEGSVT